MTLTLWKNIDRLFYEMSLNFALLMFFCHHPEVMGLWEEYHHIRGTWHQSVSSLAMLPVSTWLSAVSQVSLVQTYCSPLSVLSLLVREASYEVTRPSKSGGLSSISWTDTGRGEEARKWEMLHLGHSALCCCSVAQSCLTLRTHGLQHTRLPCPSPSPGACSNSCPLSRWCHPIDSLRWTVLDLWSPKI